MPGQFTESIVEAASLEWLECLGYRSLHGADICPDAPSAERQTYADIILIDRLRLALQTKMAGYHQRQIKEQMGKIRSPRRCRKPHQSSRSRYCPTL